LAPIAKEKISKDWLQWSEERCQICF